MIVINGRNLIIADCRGRISEVDSEGAQEFIYEVSAGRFKDVAAEFAFS